MREGKSQILPECGSAVMSNSRKGIREGKEGAWHVFASVNIRKGITDLCLNEILCDSCELWGENTLSNLEVS